jgi:hypothetical protein
MLDRFLSYAHQDAEWVRQFARDLARCRVVPRMDRGLKLAGRRNDEITGLLHRLIGGARGSRTPDLLNAIQALSQLSYGP